MTEDIIFPATKTELRQWFDKQNAVSEPTWVVIYKLSSRKQLISFNDLVEEANCHGWVDIRVKTIDEERYAILLSPRKQNSHWTEANKLLAERMISKGRMTPQGQEVYYRGPS